MEYGRKPRVLCLHGFRTSAEILKRTVSRWPRSVLDKLDLVFLNGPYPAAGISAVEGIYDPPYYEWFQSSQDFTEFNNYEESLTYIEDFMIKNGPFDGILGFSQGANLAATVPGMQSQGVALTKVPKIKFVILIAAGVFGVDGRLPKLAVNAFSSPVKIPSLHIFGARDTLKKRGIALMQSFKKPVAIHHPGGHSVPKLDEKATEAMLGFINKIERIYYVEIFARM